MNSVKVYHYDAFSTEPNKGNPAGVVFNGDDLTDKQMQEIAFKVGFNETAFVVGSDHADLGIRFFTPKQEMELCGHATMATIYALKTNGLLEAKRDVTIETKAGILPIKIDIAKKGPIYINMRQSSPQFEGYEGSRRDLAISLGINEEDIEEELPILYGSTGTWTLLVPIKSLNAFKIMKPDSKKFPSLLKEKPRASIHPFCFETYSLDADMHARHFSSPFSGTVEDAVTGTATGVLGAYLAKYIRKNAEKTLNLVVEQGQEMNKNGRVKVNVSRSGDNYDVVITGSAVYVGEFDVSLID